MCQDRLRGGLRMLDGPHWKHDLGPRTNGLWKAQHSELVTPDQAPIHIRGIELGSGTSYKVKQHSKIDGARR